MPPKPVTDVITHLGPERGPDGPVARKQDEPDPTTEDDERVTALNAVVADYARAVSTSVALLGPVIETTQTAQREAVAHPELPMGQQMGGNMLVALQTLEQVYELLRRVGAPSAPQG
jgi:hypothetical protein